MKGNLSKLSQKIQVHLVSKQDLVLVFLNIKNLGQSVQGVKYHYDNCDFLRKYELTLK